MSPACQHLGSRAETSALEMMEPRGLTQPLSCLPAPLPVPRPRVPHRSFHFNPSSRSTRSGFASLAGAPSIRPSLQGVEAQGSDDAEPCLRGHRPAHTLRGLGGRGGDARDGSCALTFAPIRGNSPPDPLGLRLTASSLGLTTHLGGEDGAIIKGGRFWLLGPGQSGAKRNFG